MELFGRRILQTKKQAVSGEKRPVLVKTSGEEGNLFTSTALDWSLSVAECLRPRCSS